MPGDGAILDCSGHERGLVLWLEVAGICGRFKILAEKWTSSKKKEKKQLQGK